MVVVCETLDKEMFYIQHFFSYNDLFQLESLAQ